MLFVVVVVGVAVAVRYQDEHRGMAVGVLVQGLSEASVSEGSQ